jgi:hypothetical protein
MSEIVGVGGSLRLTSTSSEELQAATVMLRLLKIPEGVLIAAVFPTTETLRKVPPS